MNASCPECLSDGSEVTASEVLESGLKKSFECSDCGHVWDVVF